jgi:hypothetical protein
LPSGEAANDHAARVRDAAEDGDGELPAEDDGDHPGRREIHLHQRDEGGRDEQLVGQGVEELSERGDLLVPAREVAVEPVGERREPKIAAPTSSFRTPRMRRPSNRVSSTTTSSGTRKIRPSVRRFGRFIIPSHALYDR